MRDRFQREAQTIASLNHPNICTLHDIGTGSVPANEVGLTPSEVSFLVMEHIEGETLAARISRGALPVDEALKVAGEIIDALDKAHRQGIVHRDLKPANIMLTKSGTKLLDLAWRHIRPAGFALQKRMDVTAGRCQDHAVCPPSKWRRCRRAHGPLRVRRRVLNGLAEGVGGRRRSLIGAIMKAEPRPVSHWRDDAARSRSRVCCLEDRERWQTARPDDPARVDQPQPHDTTVSPAIAGLNAEPAIDDDARPAHWRWLPG
jgi:hypothetical protein